MEEDDRVAEEKIRENHGGDKDLFLSSEWWGEEIVENFNSFSLIIKTMHFIIQTEYMNAKSQNPPTGSRNECRKIRKK